MKVTSDTKRKVSIPLDPWDGKAASLEPAARRLHVTAWAICDDTGRVTTELSDIAMARWGSLADDPARLSLSDILDDLERLGFLTSVERKIDCYRFRRSGRWMGDAAGQG